MDKNVNSKTSQGRGVFLFFVTIEYSSWISKILTKKIIYAIIYFY